MIIGLTGHKGAGKDTAARCLYGVEGVETIALADPIKAACSEWFNWGPEVLYGPSAARDAPDPGGRVRADGVPLTPRHALQQLGTEFGRACYPDIWVDIAIMRAEQRLFGAADIVLITDVRFINEARAIRKAGGTIWRITRPGYNGDSHVSETEMDSETMVQLVNVTIDNSGTIEDLKAAVRKELAR